MHLDKAVKNGMIVEHHPDILSMMNATASVYETVFAKHPEWKSIVERIRKAGEKF